MPGVGPGHSFQLGIPQNNEIMPRVRLGDSSSKPTMKMRIKIQPLLSEIYAKQMIGRITAKTDQPDPDCKALASSMRIRENDHHEYQLR